MNAADGTKIAERWARSYEVRKKDRFVNNESGLVSKLIEELSASEERERKLREILSSLYVGTRLIDNGHCAICRVGHRGWRQGRKSTEAGLCSNADCLSRRVEAALTPEGGTNG